MPYADILLQKEDGLAILTLNRPATLNAFRYQTLEEIATALDEIAGDDMVKVVIVTGSPRPDGRPCFSSGADLKERAKQEDRRREGVLTIEGASETKQYTRSRVRQGPASLLDGTHRVSSSSAGGRFWRIHAESHELQVSRPSLRLR